MGRPLVHGDTVTDGQAVPDGLQHGLRPLRLPLIREQQILVVAAAGRSLRGCEPLRGVKPAPPLFRRREKL